VRAVHALEQRLKDPQVVDEGDLFAVSLLAMAVHSIGPVEFVIHMNGFAALSSHLSNNLTSSDEQPILKAFWPFVRDEMIVYGYELSGYFNEAHSLIYKLIQTCCVGTAYETSQERQKYQSLLYGANIAGYSTSSLHKTSTQQLLLLKQCLILVTQRGVTSDLDRLSSEITSILMNVQENLHSIDDAKILEGLVTEMTRTREGDMKNMNSDIVEAVVGLLRLLLCRILIIALETRPFSRALDSASTIATAARLTSFIVCVYNIAFPLRNRGVSMTEIAIERTEAACHFRYGQRKVRRLDD
jgi:hypothetical protein